MSGGSRAERIKGAACLEVSNEDMACIRTHKRREVLAKVLLTGLAPIIGLVTGFAVGKATGPEIETDSTHPPGGVDDPCR